MKEQNNEARLYTQGLLAKQILCEIMNAKKYFPIDPDLFVESWLKLHVYYTDEDFLYRVKQIFSEAYVSTIHKLRKNNG